MKDGFIKIGAATPKIKTADTEYNAESIISAVKEAYNEGVRLLVLPELCVTGYTCGDLFFQSVLLDGAERAIEKIAAETSDMDIIFAVGSPIRRNGKLYNCAVVIKGGKVIGIVPKKYLPNYNEFYEQRHFASGDKPTVFVCRQYRELTFGIELCEDLWAVCPPSEKLALSGANIILNLSASNEMIGKADYRRNLVSGQSARLICAYAYASAGDGESTTDMVFSGHNIIAENGTVLSETKLFENGLITADIDLEKLSFERRKNTSFEYDEYAEVIEFDLEPNETELKRYFPLNPFVPSEKDDRDKRCEAILAMQVNGLKRRIEHTFAKSAVIGISGGLDSCLALLVAVRTMDALGRPRTDVTAVTMPCFGTTKRTKGNAEKLCEYLGVTLREIDIKASVEQHFSDIGHESDNYNVVYENGQARERTQILMDISNQENGLVVGTGDLSELALGWATYNGDHMSMYAVNASVPKTLVRYIVGYYSDTCGDERLSAVLNDILDTPVSPELLPADNDNITQKTEDLVGPYELHDFFLYYAVRFGYPPEKIYRIAKHTFGEIYDNAVILKWLKIFFRRFFNQQFKRSCMPDSAKVGSVTLSPRADWRMPSDAVSRLWLKELEKLSV